MPCAVGGSGSVAFDTSDSVSVKVSFCSSVVSSVVATVSVFAVWPAVKVSVVAATAVKSVPAIAVSPLSADAAHFTVTSLPLSANSTVNFTSSPSAADAGSTLRLGSGSSSSMVMVACVFAPAVAFSKVWICSVKVSSGSSRVSDRM